MVLDFQLAHQTPGLSSCQPGPLRMYLMYVFQRCLTEIIGQPGQEFQTLRFYILDGKTWFQAHIVVELSNGD